ncbi:hypothetical protein Tco_0290711 [Tanacetum coccineum]
MAFLNTAITSRYPQTNNQLRTSSNPKNQATIQDGRVTVQNVQGRQTKCYAGNVARGNATGPGVIQNTGNATKNQSNVIRCYNCKGEGERVHSGTDARALTTTVIFHTDDVDAFDSDCDEAPKQNREAHADYLKITKEHADTLRGIVEQARALKPFDNALNYACKYANRIHELLVYVSASCPSSRNDSEKLVAITPMNKNRQVSFAESSNTSTNTTQKQVDAHSNQNTNRPLLPSTRVKSSTNDSGSQPRSNTRNNSILSSNTRNNRITSSFNKTNHVFVCNANIKHDVLDANSEFV